MPICWSLSTYCGYMGANILSDQGLIRSIYIGLACYNVPPTENALGEHIDVEYMFHRTPSSQYYTLWHSKVMWSNGSLIHCCSRSEYLNVFGVQDVHTKAISDPSRRKESRSVSASQFGMISLVKVIHPIHSIADPFAVRLRWLMTWLHFHLNNMP